MLRLDPGRREWRKGRCITPIAIAQTLEVLRLEGASYLLAVSFGGSKAVRAEPFDAIELELGALWPRSSEAE